MCWLVGGGGDNAIHTTHKCYTHNISPWYRSLLLLLLLLPRSCYCCRPTSGYQVTIRECNIRQIYRRWRTASAPHHTAPQQLVREEVREGHEGEERQDDSRRDDDARDTVAPEARRVQPLEEQLGQQHPRPVYPDSVPAAKPTDRRERSETQRYVRRAARWLAEQPTERPINRTAPTNRTACGIGVQPTESAPKPTE